MSYEIYSSPNKIGQKILQMQSLLLQKWKLKTLLNQHENMRRQHSIPACGLSTGIIYIAIRNLATLFL